MKKFLAIILAALLIFCMVACSNSENKETKADDNAVVDKNALDAKSGQFLYDTNEEGDYEIIDYIPASVKVIDLLELPKTTKDGRDIVGIANEAFKAELSFKAVSIPDTYTYIGDFAFYDCDNLEKVTMTDSLASIGKHAFEGCEKLFTLDLSPEIKKLDEGVFKGCTALTSVTLGETTTEICDSAFFGCKALVLLTVSKQIEKVSKNAFYGCDNLKYTVENGAKYIGNPDNKYQVLVSAENLNIEECVVNENTSVIASGAFANCGYLSSIAIGTGVKSVDNDCFTNCTVLEYNVYDNARYLGNEENPYMVLVSVVNPSYEDLKVHADTVIITADAFASCANLEDISYDKTTEDWNAIIKAPDWNHGMNINVLCLGDAEDAE